MWRPKGNSRAAESYRAGETADTTEGIVMKETVTTTAERFADQPIVPRKCGFSQILAPMRTGSGLHQEIVSAPREVSADLVVLSTHGYTGWKHLWFVNDAGQLLLEIPCPVLVVR
jgi:nucleotide-binding universal stress UspA family protein